MKNNQGERESSARISESFNVLKDFLGSFSPASRFRFIFLRVSFAFVRSLLAKGWNVSSM